MKFFKLSFHVEGSSRSHSVRLPEFSSRVVGVGKGLVCVGIALLVLQGGIFFSYDFLKDRAIGSRISLSKKLEKEQARLDSLNHEMESRF